MKYQATKKIPGGKLIRVKIDADQNIRTITINGDFFLHPEDALPHVEQRLHGLSRHTSPEVIAQEIEQVLAERRATFVGTAPRDIAETIVEALRE